MRHLRVARVVCLLGVVAGSALEAACGGSAPAATDGGVPDASDASGDRAFVAAPDLRFKWVNAGFDLRLLGTTNIGTGTGTYTNWGALAATPLQLNGEFTSQYELFATNANLEPMVAIATAGSLATVADDLAGLLTSQSIVVSLDAASHGVTPTDPPNYNAILNGAQGGSASYLPFARGSFSADDFPTWVSTQGSLGRVVTALCPKDGALFATSFGRADDALSYETQVVTTAFDGLVAALDPLASDGYFITALGRDGTGTEGGGKFIVVGTRPAGQTTPRTVKLLDFPCVRGSGGWTTAEQMLLDEGYAIVGEIFHGTGECDGTPAWAFIGER
jgi:hypothetical protein